MLTMSPNCCCHVLAMSHTAATVARVNETLVRVSAVAPRRITIVFGNHFWTIHPSPSAAVDWVRPW